MAASYDDSARLKSERLAKIAQKLRGKSKRPSRLVPLVFMTDPSRVERLPETLAALPNNCAVIYRHFGKPRRTIIAKLLREVTYARGQQLLIGGGDVKLAKAVKADGVHFKRDAKLVGPQKLRVENADMVITMAGLKGGENYEAPLTCLDGLFISAIFPSQSPSAGVPMGVSALTDACKNLDAPVFALGGINITNAKQLISSGATGFAAISGLLS